MHAIVVGAGIAGTALAYQLTRRGVHVTLVDRGPVAELGASRWGFGGVSWASAATPATRAFADRGFQMYLAMEDELGTPFGLRLCETLVLLDGAPARDRAAELVRDFRGRGHGARIVEPEAVAALEPALDLSGWSGAMALSQAHLDLRRCARAWVAWSRGHGLDLREHVEVLSLEGDGSSIATSAGTLHADALFVVTGAWTRPLLRTAGIELPVFHSHAEFLYSDPAPPQLSHVVNWGASARLSTESRATEARYLAAWRGDSLDELVPAALELGLVQFADGHVRVGQVSRMVPGYRTEPQPEAFDRLLAQARSLWPAVDALPNLRLGFRQVAFSGDHTPIVGALPGRPAAMLVAPSASPTVLAPALGAALADYACGGTWEPLLNEWRLDRWESPGPSRPAQDRWALT